MMKNKHKRKTSSSFVKPTLTFVKKIKKRVKKFWARKINNKPSRPCGPG